MLERESIRTLCDRLRRERDRAVSDLAEALRDSDDIKRQRNDTTKELKGIIHFFFELDFQNSFFTFNDYFFNRVERKTR